MKETESQTPKDLLEMVEHSARIPDHIQKMQGYVPGKTLEEVQKLYRPAMIAKLASNENRLGYSPLVREAVMERLSVVQNYPDPLSLKLRKELARRNGVDPSYILVTAGSESAISILCRTFLQGGSDLQGESDLQSGSDLQGRANVRGRADVRGRAEAVTAEATFVGFFVQAGIMNANVVRVPMAEGFRFDGRAMLAAIREETRMIYLANPNNPTGTYMPADEFRMWLDGIPDHVLIVVDEAYLEYAVGVEDYPRALNYLHGRPNMILLRTFSKAYGLAGFRIGYAIGDTAFIEQLAKVKLTFEPTVAAQAAALAALRDEEFLERSVDLVRGAREQFYAFLKRQGRAFVPSISNSVMMVFDSEQEAAWCTEEMLKRGVILRRLGAFGLPHCVRVTMGTPAEMTHFEDSYKDVMKEWGEESAHGNEHNRGDGRAHGVEQERGEESAHSDESRETNKS